MVPLIKPPTPAELESDKELVTAKFDEAQQILETLKNETAEVKLAQEEQKQKVDLALETVGKTVAELQESGRRRESDLRAFKSDIDSIRELIPKVSPSPPAALVPCVSHFCPRCCSSRAYIRMSINVAGFGAE